VVLLFQRAKGPRFFIPKRFRNSGYDYVRSFQEEADLESQNLGNDAWAEECIICMNPLRNEVDDNMNQNAYRRISTTYMQTPCNHKFHKACLTNWIRVKLECPVCRVSLPPLDED